MNDRLGPSHRPAPRLRTHPKSRRPRWLRILRKPAVWGGSVITAVMVGVVTWKIQQFFSPAVAPSASPAVSASVSPAPSVSGAPTSTRSGLAVRVAATQVEHTEDHEGWVFREKLDLTNADLKSLRDRSTDEWFTERGAVDPDFSAIKLVLEGNRNKPVRIVGMRAITRCTAPLAGTLFVYPNGGVDESVKIGFDLDRPRPIAQTLEGYKLGGDDYFANKTVSLKSGEQQTFQIAAKTSEHYCQYRLELSIVDDGKTVTQLVDNNGEPFQVTARVTKGYWTTPGAFSSYRALYVGGLALPGGRTTRKDPATYGLGEDFG